MAIGKSRRRLIRRSIWIGGCCGVSRKDECAANAVGHDFASKWGFCFGLPLDLPLSVYRDFIHGKAQPKRSTWVDVRYWYMASLASGKEWMQDRVKDRNCKGLVFYESSRYQVQKDSLRDYRKKKLSPREVQYNKVYPAFGKPSDKDFEIWRKENKSNRLF